MTPDETALHDILALIERSVNAQDYDALRPHIPSDSEMFGSFEPVMTGFDEMAEKQFRIVWPRIGTFTMDKASIRVKAGTDIGYASNFFSTEGTGPDGKVMRRKGRMSWVFEKRGEAWQIVHSHDSLAPERQLQANP